MLGGWGWLGDSLVEDIQKAIAGRWERQQLLLLQTLILDEGPQTLSQGSGSLESSEEGKLRAGKCGYHWARPSQSALPCAPRPQYPTFKLY